MTTPAPTCHACGRELVLQFCFGHIRHFRCQRCPSASCYEVMAGRAQSVKCKGVTEFPAGDVCGTCGRSGGKPPPAPTLNPTPKIGSGP